MFERVLSWGALSAGGRLGLPGALVSAVLLLTLPVSAQEEAPNADDDGVEVTSETPPPGEVEEFGEPVLPLWDRREQERGTIPRGFGPSSSSILGSKEAFDARRRTGSVQGFAGIPPGLAVNGSLSASLAYDDNPLLENSEDIGAENTAFWGYDIRPGLDLTHRSARTVFQSLVRLSINDLVPIDQERDVDLDSFDQYGGMQLDRMGPRSRLNLFANIANGAARTEIIEETGRALSNEKVLTYGGGGSLTYAVSPRAEIQVFAASRRREVETARLRNFTSVQAGAAYDVDLTSVDRAGLSAQYERVIFGAPASPTADIVTALATWSHRANFALSFDLEAGPQFIFGRSGNGVKDEETALDFFVGAAVQVAASERDRFTITASRSAVPSVTGEVRTHNRVEASYERQMSRDISFRLPVALSIQGDVFDDGSESRSLLSVAPELVWALAPKWGCAAQYRYWLENEEGRSSASSNRVMVSLRYLGQLLP